MKNPKEYLKIEINKVSDLDQPWIDYTVYDGKATPIFSAIKEAQKDAYNQALEDAAENIKMKTIPEENYNKEIHGEEEYIIQGYDYRVVLDKQSILKLKK